MQALKFGPSYTSSDLGWDAQRTVNLIPEIDETSEAKSGLNLRLVTAPGVTLTNPLAHNPNLRIRGLLRLATDLVIIVGHDTTQGRSYVFTYNESTATTSTILRADDYVNGPPDTIGSAGWLVDNTTYASQQIRFAYNGMDLVIVDGPSELIKVNLRDSVTPGYIWSYMRNASNLLDYHPLDVAFVGGYFVFVPLADFNFDSVTNDKFYISGLYDTTMDPLDVATTEYKADGLVAAGSISNALWLFGRRTLEVWANTGGVDFPFERINGASSDIGMLARASLQQLTDAFMWLACTSGGRPFIAMTQGYAPTKMSTIAIDTELAKLSVSELELATSFAYSHAGHYYYGLNVPALNTTFVYDLHSKMWHERTYTVGGVTYSAGYAHSTPGMGGEKFVYRHNEPGIFELEFEANTLMQTWANKTGVPMVCERAFPIVSHASGNRIQHNKVQLDSSAGSEATQPAFTLQWSDNSGKDFVDGRTLQPADVGEYNERFIWRRLGASRSRLYKLSFSTAQQLSLRSVMLDSEVLGG